jgi:hypothetical protein
VLQRWRITFRKGRFEVELVALVPVNPPPGDAGAG